MISIEKAGKGRLFGKFMWMIYPKQYNRFGFVQTDALLLRLISLIKESLKIFSTMVKQENLLIPRPVSR